MAVDVLDGFGTADMMDVVPLDINLGVQMLVDQIIDVETSVVIAHSQLTQIESHDVSKAQFVGKIEFDQFIIDPECIATSPQANDTPPLGLNTLVDDAYHLKGGLVCALFGALDHRCGQFLITRERCEFYLIFRTIITVGYLKKLNIGL